MDELLAAAEAAFDAVRAAAASREPSAMESGRLMAVNEAFGVLRRSVDAAYLPVATEISRQSRPELAKDSFARKQGYRTPATLISATTGATVGDAVRLVAVGEATAPRMTLTGDRAPAKHPHVAAAVNARRIAMPAASAIITMLDRVALRADPAALDAMELRLAESAPGLTLDQLNRLIVRAEAHLDPDGIEPREQELRADRTLSIREDHTGRILFSGTADPATGAPILAAINDLVSGMLRRRDEAEKTDAATGAAPMADARSIGQMRIDALADLCRHSLGCLEAPTSPSTTVIVRIDLESLEKGVGAGTIDGTAQPVSASTVRRMAADAQIIPCVLGGDSEILDWGRAKRLFTPTQKLALVERDGGCAFCGLPPSMTVGHHLRWWERDRGKTDLRNGILLCVACHHRIHDDGWEIRVDGIGTHANVWFIPPPWLDPERRPRLGGRARYDLVA